MANSATLAQLQGSPAARNSKWPTKWVRDPVCAEGTEITTLLLLAGVALSFGQVWMCLYHCALVVLACTCPPSWPRTTCPGSREAWQTQLPGAPGQSLAGIQALALTQVLVLLGQATWQTHQQQPVRKPPPSHQATGKPIYFMYWDRRISKRLGRFAHFIITVLGHSYTEDCSPSCLWEVPIAPGWVTDTLYHNTASGKALHSGDWSQRTDLATPCSLWVTVLNPRA